MITVLCLFKHIASKDVVITLLHRDDPVSPLLPAMHAQTFRPNVSLIGVTRCRSGSQFLLNEMAAEKPLNRVSRTDP